MRARFFALVIAVIGAGLGALPARAATDATEATRIDEISADQPISQTVIELAGWIIATEDHRGLPFAIIDKAAAQILVFSADGKLNGIAPALLGSAVGDRSTPGVAELPLSAIPAQDRTTPAGRFYASYGPAPGGKKVLWVDYGSAVSIHPLAESDRSERRLERLSTASPSDNRITHGCINVSPTFYSDVVRPTFKKDGVFYVLPETTSLAEALPAFSLTERKSNGKKRR